VVVVDTAPVGIVSDAMALSKFANASIYIVRQGYTFKRQITWLDEFYRQNKLPKISIILNDVRQRLGYGSYGYGQYGSGYTSSYFDEVEAPPTLLSTWMGWLGLGAFKKRKKKEMKILVTGGAGFIGCNLVQRLLATEGVTAVRVLDNLATGSVKNIEPFRADSRFEFMEGDIRSYEACLQACEGMEPFRTRRRWVPCPAPSTTRLPPTP
jgi:hypothetical protein